MASYRRPKFQVVTFQFKNVKLLKDQSIGIGSYGAVCKAKCDDLLCAAKIIHPTLFDPIALDRIAPQREHRLPIRRFEQECEFMSTIRHPNIVQYLGMFRDTETHLPVLLMELMDDSLTQFLERAMQPIPFHIQVNICHDITLALSFLHSNNIIHRDLSSNNVLLRGNSLAKVTDFGMAQLSDINPQVTHFTNTMCPGTDVYMPPEALQDKPVYTEKIDCFSFGVITVQIMTQQFPKPGDRLQEVEFSHPDLPPGKILVQLPEVNRRQNHISQVNSDHPLLIIALDCLKDNDSERPSAHQLCERVADQKEMLKYLDSKKVARDKNEGIPPQTVGMDVNEHTMIPSMQEVNQQLRHQLQEERYHASIILEEKERQLANIKQELEASKQLVVQLERQVSELKQQVSVLEQQNSIATSREEESSIKLKWNEGKNLPHGMNRSCDAVVDSNMVYVRNGDTDMIYCYDVISDTWSQLLYCVYESCSITIINGLLTTVGGYHYLICTNELFSLTGEGSNRKWAMKYPPMPTERSDTTAVCDGITLIVAGGIGNDRRVVLTVEVMNTENLQWSTAADLIKPIYSASATVCGDQFYMLCGASKDHAFTKSVYTCSVSALLQSCVSSSLEAKFEKTSLVDKASDCVWKQVADLPVTDSCCESFHGQLLAVGGRIDPENATTAVYMFSPATNSWGIISHMTIGRYDCSTAILPDNKLMVVGGFTDYGMTDSVEVASVYN